MSDDLLSIVRLAAVDLYFEFPNTTRAGAVVFADEMLKLLTPGLVARAREAAAACEADYPVLNPTPFQESLRRGIIDAYCRTVRAHPRLDDQAAAFAETIIEPFGREAEAAALRYANRMGTASEHLAQVEHARAREEEIRRNRRKPPRRPLYPC
jgi:hypothetical protein